MSESENNREDWKHFWNVLSYPWSVAFFVPTLLLNIALVIVDPSDKFVFTLFTFIVSLSSGVLGGVLAKRWDDLAEGRVIVARGKSAIRSLMLLFKNVQILKKRVEIYLWRHTDEEYTDNISPEVIQTYFEELILACQLIEEEVLSSVDNWQDIIPEADVESQSRIIRELAVEQIALAKEMLRLGKELEKVENAKEQTEEEKEELRTRLRRKQKELSEMEKKLLRKDPLNVGTAALTAGSGTSIGPIGRNYETIDFGADVGQFSPNSIIFAPARCQMCGKTIPEGNAGLDIMGYCSECSQKSVGIFLSSDPDSVD